MSEVAFYLNKFSAQVADRSLEILRCGSFQNMLRNEICKIPGSKVGAGSPTPIRLPQAKPEVFKEVLFYIYTGKIVLQDTTLFEALALSHELGLEELRLLCEDFITCTLSTHNACTYLASVLLLEHRLQGQPTLHTPLFVLFSLELVEVDSLVIDRA
ncbi:TLD [Cordylochernes scorpioides]|uniref:TLD n=1 Tax=Cordylochernes scorpioides TaxID=51811 RepID=A0ABY6JW24_9ARAC|nr:TLD [Cordylochernes scorpioides]